ncbi:MAG: hypothetical protein M4579_002427 [Chaenotheca gracillima]|nr:MAG: hypothetical protein M4579_002427 [Chaenotheca gracillima]
MGEVSIEEAPAPWTCKCSMYWMMFSISGPLPENAYAPLEAETAAVSDPEKSGQFRGGLGSMQIVRYSSTPAGSYDELLIVPGTFDVPGTKDKNNRITRIYVSQKKTCYNANIQGRKNWGIPKHLARFVFTTPPTISNSPKVLKVEVFPPDPAAEKPFLTATFQQMRYLPGVPLSTNIMPYIGLDVRMSQPPLPASLNPSEGELVGSDHWYRTLPAVYAPKAIAMWVDFRLPKAKGNKGEDSAVDGEEVTEDLAAWWPDVKPWKFGLWVEDATLEFGEPEILKE